MVAVLAPRRNPPIPEVRRVGDRRAQGSLSLAAQIAELEATLAGLKAQQRTEQDVGLLRAIILAIGNSVFTVRDLFARIPLQVELRDVLAGSTRNALGRRLMQLTNRECGGLTVQLVERERAGRVYAIIARHHAASVDDRDGA